MSTADARLDPTANTQNHDLTPAHKIEELHKLLKTVTAGMLATRAADGHLHSRAMAPCGPITPTQTTLYFLANNVTHKFDEIHNDSHVNVSFYDPTTTSWASYDATATVTQDRELIKKHWNKMYHPGYFGDLKDGTHKGDEHDPRVSIIEVVPSEIRHWVGTSSSVSRAAQQVYSTVTGKGSAPGELRIITEAEIKLTQGLDSKP